MVPPAEAPRGAALIAAFVRNPLEALPQAVYEQDFVAATMRRMPRAWVTSPSLVKAVLLDERDKFRKLTSIRLLSPLLGRGLLTSEGAEWKWQRQAAAPLFRPQELTTFVPTFVGCAQRLVDEWRMQPAGTVHAIERAMTQVTFDVIAATLLPSADDDFSRTLQGAVGRLQRHGGWDILFASLMLPRWLPRPGLFAGRRTMRALRSSVTARLRAHREGQAGGARHDDLVARLVAARDPETGRSMDEVQLVDNVLTFYLAGHETTAKALAWTLYLLARSPEWTQAVEDEIARVVGHGPVEAGHIDQLVVVQQVIKESMRLFPPVPIVSRQAVTELVLEGHRIPPGMSILMPIYAIHRHAARWERPGAFDPTRFAPERERAIPRYQYMPFGAGPRICIGLSFALIEAAAILATLLQRLRFRWAGHDEPVPVARLTLIPRGGIPLAVSPRE